MAGIDNVIQNYLSERAEEFGITMSWQTQSREFMLFEYKLSEDRSLFMSTELPDIRDDRYYHKHQIDDVAKRIVQAANAFIPEARSAAYMAWHPGYSDIIPTIADQFGEKLTEFANSIAEEFHIGLVKPISLTKSTDIADYLEQAFPDYPREGIEPGITFDDITAQSSEIIMTKLNNDPTLTKIVNAALDHELTTRAGGIPVSNEKLAEVRIQTMDVLRENGLLLIADKYTEPTIYAFGRDDNYGNIDVTLPEMERDNLGLAKAIIAAADAYEPVAATEDVKGAIALWADPPTIEEIEHDSITFGGKLNAVADQLSQEYGIARDDKMLSMNASVSKWIQTAFPDAVTDGDDIKFKDSMTFKSLVNCKTNEELEGKLKISPDNETFWWGMKGLVQATLKARTEREGMSERNVIAEAKKRHNEAIKPKSNRVKAHTRAD